MRERWERKRERKDGNEVWKRNEREMEAVKGEESQKLIMEERWKPKMEMKDGSERWKRKNGRMKDRREMEMKEWEDE